MKLGDIKREPGVYRITNLKSRKIYIGSSKRVRDRLRIHRNRLKRGDHANSHLQASYNKHGKDSFEFDIVEYCDDYRENEQRMLDRYIDSGNWDKLYNKCKSVEHPPPPSEELKKKLREMRQGTVTPESVRKKIGKSILEAHREDPSIAEKMSESTKKYYEENEHHWKSHDFSEEHLRNIRSGVRKSKSTLSLKDIIEIRARFYLGETLKALSNDYEISTANISRIANGRRWGDIQGAPIRGTHYTER